MCVFVQDLTSYIDNKSSFLGYQSTQNQAAPSTSGYTAGNLGPKWNQMQVNLDYDEIRGKSSQTIVEK